MANAELISIVDDDESVRDSTQALLRSVGYEVLTFESAEGFLASDGMKETECLVLDLRMPGMNGLELQRRLNQTDFHIPVIFITAHDDPANRRQAANQGAVGFLCKPFDPGALVSAVEGALNPPHSLG